MQWPLTSQSHASFLKENNCFFVMDQTLCPYPTRSLPAQFWSVKVIVIVIVCCNCNWNWNCNCLLSVASVSAVLFFVLALQTGLTSLEPEKRFARFESSLFSSFFLFLKNYHPIGLLETGKVGRQKKKNYHPIPWRESISRPISPISLVAGGDDTTRPRRQGSSPAITLLSPGWPDEFVE
jgi:hypothetical protein